MVITLNGARTAHSYAPTSNSFFPAHDPEGASASIALGSHLHQIHEYSFRKQFSRNEEIFSQGDPAGDVFKVLSGTVRLCRYMHDGRRYIVDFLFPGDLTGFIEGADQTVSAEAVSEVTLLYYPRACCDRLAEESGAMRALLVSHISDNLMTAYQHLFVLGCQKAKERVASFLLRLADRLGLGAGDLLGLTMGRQDIADHLGLTTETVCRTIAALKSERVVLVPNAHQLILNDLDALRILAAKN
ncbi:MAG TPA: cyclic nucleotide-binding domain-containing protein [Rhizomicrobium sp.]